MNTFEKKSIKDYVEQYGEPTINIVSDLFVEGTVGALIPGVTSFLFAVRSRRLEDNMNLFIKKISKKIDYLETQYEKLNAEDRKAFKNGFSEIIVDYIAEEREEEKIELLVNGFQKLLEKDYDIQNTSLFFDVLKELRYIDILVLKQYDHLSKEYWDKENAFREFLESLNLDMDRYKYIKEKLVRSGLLISSYEKEHKYLIEAFLKLSQSLKDSKKKLDRNVTHPKFKRRERISLSPFGRAFITFFKEGE